MRQTLALAGVLRSVTTRGTTSHGAAPPREVRLLVRRDCPEAASSSWIDAIVFRDECPEHEAVLQAHPGDRVELTGHWHGFDGFDPDGNLVTIELFYVERFRKVDS